MWQVCGGGTRGLPVLGRKSFGLPHPSDLAGHPRGQEIWPQGLSWLHALSLPGIFPPGLITDGMATFSMDLSVVPVGPCGSQHTKVPVPVYQETSLLLSIKHYSIYGVITICSRYSGAQAALGWRVW